MTETRATDRTGDGAARHAIVHVPKCAGSTMRLQVSKFDGAYVGPKYFDASLLGRKELDGASATIVAQLVSGEDLRAIVERSTVVVGHYAAHTLVEAGADMVWVMVREPRARLVSLYRFWQHLGSELGDWGARGERIGAAVSSTFGDFLRSDLVAGDVVGDIARYVLPASMRHESPDGAWLLDKAVTELADPGAIRAALEGSRPWLAGAVWGDGLRSVLEVMAARHAPEGVDIDADSVERETPVSPQDQSIGATELDLLERATRADRFVLSWMMEADLLPRRTDEELDRIFWSTAARHGLLIE